MCLAIPGKIKTLEDKTAVIDYSFEERTVLRDPNIKVSIGDYVLVQMGMIIKQIPAEQAEESLKAWKENS